MSSEAIFCYVCVVRRRRLDFFGGGLSENFESGGTKPFPLTITHSKEKNGVGPIDVGDPHSTIDASWINNRAVRLFRIGYFNKKKKV